MKLRDALTLVLALLIIAVIVTAQQPATPQPPLLNPTEVQALRLENAQLKVRALIQQAQELWSTTCAQVKRENNWPDAAVCDLSASPVRVFVPQQQAAQPAPKPAEKK